MKVGWALAIVGTLVLLFAVDKTKGLCLPPAEEAAGFDVAQQGEEGYEFAA